MRITETSLLQVASMLKEKTAFLQKHDQMLFEIDFRDHLTKSLKAKKQTIAAAMAEVSKWSFWEGPSFCRGKPNWGQKFKSNYNGKYILFQKKGTPWKQQSNFTSGHDKYGGINSCSFNSKNKIFQSKDQPAINSKDLDRSFKHFNMEGLHCLKYVLQKGDYMCKIDLEDEYDSVPQLKDSRKLNSLGRELPVSVWW